MQFVEHRLSDGNMVIIRQYQKECWDALFSKMSLEEIETLINRKFMSRKEGIIVFEMDSIEYFLERVQEILITTKYKIEIHIR